MGLVFQRNAIPKGEQRHPREWILEHIDHDILLQLEECLSQRKGVLFYKQHFPAKKHIFLLRRTVYRQKSLDFVDILCYSSYNHQKSVEMEAL